MLVAVVLVMLASLSVMVTASNAIVGGKKDLRLSGDSRQAYFYAEAGLEDVILRLKQGDTVTQPIEVVPIGAASSTVIIDEIASGKQATALGASGEALRNLQGSVASGEGVDFSFGLHVGSIGITMGSGSSVAGSVFTNGSISGSSGSSIVGDAYAAGTISSPPSVSGTRETGVAPVPLPELDLDYWRTQANINNNPYQGNLTLSGNSNTIGPRKIVGNLTLSSNALATVTGPIHVTGNLVINSNTDLYLDESFGSAGTMIVVDGTITFDSNAEIYATSANPKGYLLFASASSGTAVDLHSGSVLAALVYAPNGSVDVNSNSGARSIVAKGVTLASNAEIQYEVGLADSRFTTGPGGGFEISGWGEVE